jgi:hypothetical protein
MACEGCELRGGPWGMACRGRLRDQQPTAVSMQSGERAGLNGCELFLFQDCWGCKAFPPAAHSFPNQGMAARRAQKLGAGDAALVRKGLAALGADADTTGAASGFPASVGRRLILLEKVRFAVNAGDTPA